MQRQDNARASSRSAAVRARAWIGGLQPAKSRAASAPCAGDRRRGRGVTPRQIARLARGAEGKVGDTETERAGGAGRGRRSGLRKEAQHAASGKGRPGALDVGVHRCPAATRPDRDHPADPPEDHPPPARPEDGRAIAEIGQPGLDRQVVARMNGSTHGRCGARRIQPPARTGRIARQPAAPSLGRNPKRTRPRTRTLGAGR